MKRIILILLLLAPVFTFAQTMRWERIKPISDQTELLTPDTADFLLVEDATDGLRKSLKIITLPLSQAAQDSIEALWSVIDGLSTSSHPALTKTGSATFGQLDVLNQVLNLDKIDLGNSGHVAGVLLDANISSAATWNAKQDAITAGNQLSFSGNTLNVLDGSGSGLDADLLRGITPSGFDRVTKYDGVENSVSANDMTQNGTYFATDNAYTTTSFTDLPFTVGSGGFTLYNMRIGTAYNFQMTRKYGANLDFYIRSSYYSGGKVYESWKKLWDESNLTSLSQLINNVGFITSETDPTVNNSIITLQRNGVDIGNFNLNQSINETFNFIDNNTTYTSSDFNHNSLTNTHNLTTDIDHDQLTNFLQSEHFTQSEISITKNQISDFGDYLSRSGGSMLNTNLVTNLNANYLKGFSTGSGDYTNSFIPVVKVDGGGEVGRYFDFHDNTTTFVDYDVRFFVNGGASNGAGSLTIHSLNTSVTGNFTATNLSGTNTGDQVASDFNHDSLINTHNLTTDIDHDQLTNFLQSEHFTQSEISITKNQISDFGDYLSRSGGSMLNTNLVTNLNANYLNGKSNADFDRVTIFSGAESSFSANDMTKNGTYLATDNAYTTTSFTDLPFTVGSGGFGLYNINYGTNYNMQLTTKYGNGSMFRRNSYYSGGKYYGQWKEIWDSGNLNLFDGTEDIDLNTAEVNIEAYNATTWNGSRKAVTQDAMRDKIETFGSIATKGYWIGTQAAYDALGTYDSNTIYFIED
ncbi:hypothetical protein [Draconibacterium sp.]|uniref:phage upper tail fiber protein n=1 Tax=Draconibacterium sp. TaxID=1965318 RepID=UPI003568B13A